MLHTYFLYIYTVLIKCEIHGNVKYILYTFYRLCYMFCTLAGPKSRSRHVLLASAEADGQEGLGERAILGIPRIGWTFLEVPILRIVVFWGSYWGSYWGPPFLGKLPFRVSDFGRIYFFKRLRRYPVSCVLGCSIREHNLL